MRILFNITAQNLFIQKQIHRSLELMLRRTIKLELLIEQQK